MITDSFQFMKQALLISAVPLDCSLATSVLGFEIGGNNPPDSRRKFLFKIDDKIFKFAGNLLTEINIELNLQNVLNFGNSADELLTIDNVPAFVGKKIYPVIALQAPTSAAVMPSVSFAIKAKNFGNVLSKFQLSPTFYLPNNSIFQNAAFDTDLSSDSSAVLKIQLKNNDSWSDWFNISDAVNQPCQAVKLAANLTVPNTSPTSFAQIKNVSLSLNNLNNAVPSNKTEIFLKPVDFPQDLSVCYLLIYHKNLQNNNLRAFVCFDDAPSYVDNLQLGIGNGELQTFTLEPNIDFDSLNVKVSFETTFEYVLNAKEQQLKIIAPPGKIISISYFHNMPPENWIELEHQFTDFDKNFDSDSFISRFVYRKDSPGNSKIAKIKIFSEIQEGDDNFSFTATGKNQILPLNHTPVPTSISSNVNFFFDEDNNVLKVNGIKDSEYNVAYSWHGEPIKINKIAVAFGL